MPYVVIKRFRDGQDKEHEYSIGEAYPRKGTEVTEDRLAALSGEDNNVKAPVIEKVTEGEDGDEEFPKHKGGGHYVLSNGETVKGKDEALEAEKALTE